MVARNRIPTSDDEIMVNWARENVMDLEQYVFFDRCLKQAIII